MCGQILSRSLLPCAKVSFATAAASSTPASVPSGSGGEREGAADGVMDKEEPEEEEERGKEGMRFGEEEERGKEGMRFGEKEEERGKEGMRFGEKEDGVSELGGAQVSDGGRERDAASTSSSSAVQCPFPWATAASVSPRLR